MQMAKINGVDASQVSESQMKEQFQSPASTVRSPNNDDDDDENEPLLEGALQEPQALVAPEHGILFYLR